MENRRVRIRDIAEELGLSTATVSNVLHGKTAKISEETVRRVQALLEEREYIPSMAGILLAQNASRIVGVVINDHEKYESHALEDPFISSALNALSAELSQNDLFLMVRTATTPEEIIRFGSMWNLDGLVLIGFCAHDYEHLRRHMRIPFVVYDGYFEQAGGICNITIDNYSGGFQVGEAFRRDGHRRVLCIADNEICVDKERLDGFCDGFAGQADFLCIPMREAERMPFYEQNLNVLKQYSAIFAVSDFYAIELMRFLAAHGVAVPDGIAVAGFDDTPLCRMVWPELTSVRQDSAARARLAVQKLRALREGSEPGTTVRLPVTLIERASTRKA